jgi:hypothetical protein
MESFFNLCVDTFLLSIYRWALWNFLRLFFLALVPRVNAVVAHMWRWPAPGPFTLSTLNTEEAPLYCMGGEREKPLLFDRRPPRGALTKPESGTPDERDKATALFIHQLTAAFICPRAVLLRWMRSVCSVSPAIRSICARAFDSRSATGLPNEGRSPLGTWRTWKPAERLSFEAKGEWLPVENWQALFYTVYIYVMRQLH